tara:strand:- start:2848 stop:3315 length:468 start_codon:yes stop_codon:yes gene_type:complete
MKFSSDKFRIMRLQKNLSQEEMGEIIGFSKSTVQRWEIGNSVPAANYLRSMMFSLLEVYTPKEIAGLFDVGNFEHLLDVSEEKKLALRWIKKSGYKTPLPKEMLLLEFRMPSMGVCIYECDQTKLLIASDPSCVIQEKLEDGYILFSMKKVPVVF